MSDDRAPLEQVLDLVLYAPLGLLRDAQRRFPELAREGRQEAEQRVILARFVGKMAVHIGRQELGRRLAALRPETPTVEGACELDAIEAVAVDVEPDVERDVEPEENLPDVEPEENLPNVEPDVDVDMDVDVDDLAIVGYDSLSASQVVGRLDALSDEELDAIDAYEAAHRHRRTVLAKVAQLRDSRR